MKWPKAKCHSEDVRSPIKRVWACFPGFQNPIYLVCHTATTTTHLSKFETGAHDPLKSLTSYINHPAYFSFLSFSYFKASSRRKPDLQLCFRLFIFNNVSFSWKIEWKLLEYASSYFSFLFNSSQILRCILCN